MRNFTHRVAILVSLLMCAVINVNGQSHSTNEEFRPDTHAKARVETLDKSLKLSNIQKTMIYDIYFVYAEHVINELRSEDMALHKGNISRLMRRFATDSRRKLLNVLTKEQREIYKKELHTLTRENRV